MFRKILRRRLNKKLDQAVQLGAMTKDEAIEIREQTEVAEIFILFEILMLIIKLIRSWREAKAGDEN